MNSPRLESASRGLWRTFRTPAAPHSCRDAVHVACARPPRLVLLQRWPLASTLEFAREPSPGQPCSLLRRRHATVSLKHGRMPCAHAYLELKFVPGRKHGAEFAPRRRCPSSLSPALRRPPPTLALLRYSPQHLPRAPATDPESRVVLRGRCAMRTSLSPSRNTAGSCAQEAIYYTALTTYSPGESSLSSFLAIACLVWMYRASRTAAGVRDKASAQRCT